MNRYIALFVKMVGLVMVVAGITLSLFASWQLDTMIGPMIWGGAADRMKFYSDLIGNGYSSMSQLPYTINVWLFPDMTAGVMYDSLQMMSYVCAIVSAIGGFILHDSIVTTAKKLTVKVKSLTSE